MLKTMDEFNFLEAPFIPKNKILKLMDCSFIEEHTNLILVGGSGVGKKEGYSPSFSSFSSILLLTLLPDL